MVDETIYAFRVVRGIVFTFFRHNIRSVEKVSTKKIEGYSTFTLKTFSG